MTREAVNKLTNVIIFPSYTEMIKTGHPNVLGLILEKYGDQLEDLDDKDRVAATKALEDNKTVVGVAQALVDYQKKRYGLK